MSDILIMTNVNYMTVAVENISTSTVLEFTRYHGYPTINLDNMFDFANWCMERNYKTYIYVDKEQPLFWKLLFKFTFWMGIKCGKFHSELIRGRP